MLKAKDVAFQYMNSQRGLPPTNLEVSAGSIHLITGSSGSGKSTFARCLTGIIPQLYQGKFSGEVCVNGYNTAREPLWKLSEKVGMVFQNPAAQVLRATVEDEIIFGLENLGLNRDEISRRLDKIMIDFKLSEFRGRSPATLSGGEQQKLVLAAMIARTPEILVLDEPLSMLDTTSSAALISYLQRYSDQGSAVVMFEHRQEYLCKIPNVKKKVLGKYIQRVDRHGKELGLKSQPAFRLEVNDLSVRFGSHKILDRIHLNFDNGEIVAIVGRNGVGKTTLLRTILGLQKHEGNILIHNSSGAVKPDLGMVFQNPDIQLFNPTVREEILYRIDQPNLSYYRNLLNALGLVPYEETPPLLLSEGEKKRLALALVLIHRPAHGIMLDEPSLGQDSYHKEILVRIMHSLAEAGQLVLMTTHDLFLASKADRLILLGSGGIIMDGKTDDVFQNRAAWDKAGILLPEWLINELP